MGNANQRTTEYTHICETKREGESGIMRHFSLGDSRPMLDELAPGIDTMLKAFESTREIHGDREFLGTRELIQKGQFGRYRWKTYDDVFFLATALARGIVELNLTNTLEDLGRRLQMVGIFCITREEWLITDIATWYISATNVPLYTSLSAEDMNWVFSQTLLETVFASIDCALKLISAKSSGKISSLKNIVLYDPIPEEEQKHFFSEAVAAGLTVYTYNDVINVGKKSQAKLRHSERETLMSICYTSGTTGRPKGAEVTHNAVLSGASSLYLQRLVKMYPGMTNFSFLPLAHMYERNLTYMGIMNASRIGYFHGDFSQIVQDMQELKPNVIVGVPRIYNRFYRKMSEAISNSTGFKKWMLNKAIRTKEARYKKDGVYTHALFDKLVFKKFREITGGCVECMVSAAAPIDPKVLEFLKLLLSCGIVQGYGLTETLAAVSLNYPEDSVQGSLGCPLLSSELKLVDVPEMEYTVKNEIEGQLRPRGEICVRGRSVMRRYFRDEELTKEMFDSEGWLHTGDIGELLPAHSVLRVIDRKKNLFKLQQGEYVSPEKLENIFSQNPYITQVFVHGESMECYPIGIIVPNKECIRRWCKKNGADSYTDIIEMYKSPIVQKEILKSLETTGKESKLAGFEILKKILITNNEFTEENGLLTPTLKLKRHMLRKKFASDIVRMYQEIRKEA